MTATMGPFERNGITPSYLGTSRVVRIEATRTIVVYLAENGCLGEGVGWEDLPPMSREAWVDALSDRYAKAHREASKEAMKELAAYEALAIELPCSRCYAEAGEKCRDLRRNFLVHNKHVHQERLDALAAEGL